MPTMNLPLPDELSARINLACKRHAFAKTKFIRKGIEMALAELAKAYGTPDLAPPTLTVHKTTGVGITATPAMPRIRPQVNANAPAYANPYGLAPLKRGEATWFALDAVCRSLGVAEADVLAELDPADDIEQYLGKQWVALDTVAQAKTLCPDPDLGDKVLAFCVSSVEA